MSKKDKKQSNKGIDMTTENVNETESTTTEEPSEDITDSSETTTGEKEEIEPPNNMISDTDIVTVICEKEPFTIPENETDPDVIELYRLMNSYVKNIQLESNSKRVEENVIKFVAIGKFISRRNREKLVEVFFTEIMSSSMSFIMSQDLVFQFIERINDDDKRKIQTLYTSLMTLRTWLENPKHKLGFPLDFGKIEDSFGGNALSNFIKRFVQP